MTGIVFERYTEPARRTIFFSRYEASQFGSTTIEIGHLLLGLVREDRALLERFLPEPGAVDQIRKDVEARMPTAKEKVATSLDLPLTTECKRALAYAAEEAERLDHPYRYPTHVSGDAP